MKVKDHKKFCAFDYVSDLECPQEYELGDIVTRDIYGEVEIGVVIQIHSEYDLRTDMFGNSGTDDLDLSTLEEIELFRNKLLPDLELSK